MYILKGETCIFFSFKVDIQSYLGTSYSNTENKLTETHADKFLTSN